jgi:Protein of unknown function, DUF488
VIYTIGHSTRSAEEFLSLLESHSIQLVADVRSLPRSRRHPQFTREALDGFLTDHEIVYRHFPALGGLRTPRADSTNTAWQHAGFRGYADYMQLEAFDDALNACSDLHKAVGQPSCARSWCGGIVTAGCCRMHFLFAVCQCGTFSICKKPNPMS